MEILKCGITVIFKLARIEGMITCAAIRFDKVTYEVTYFINGKSESTWVNEFEIEVKDPETQSIGFKK